MRRGWFFGVLLACWVVDPALAQHAQHAGHGDHPITSLSAEQRENLRNGRGMGLALAAERNQYPGPSHVLELGDKLGLTSAQRTQVQAQFDQMHAASVALGEQVISQEAALDRLFANRAVTDESLTTTTAAIGVTQARLRAAHLGAHLRMVGILTAEQIRQYAALRGHTDSVPTRHPHQH